ncbi:MAG TPA: tetratricopeptide repeat protein, partial [Limnochordales bacterium]
MGTGRPVSLVAAVAFSLAGAAAAVAVAVSGEAGPPAAAQPAVSRPAGSAPSSSPAARWVGIALELLARGRTEAALAPLEQARQADPENLEASVLLASARLALQEPERALAALPGGSRASLSSQEEALVQTLRGMAHQRLGQAEAAVGAYRRAVEADGRTALAWVGLGQLARQAAADPAGPANQWGWPA